MSADLVSLDPSHHTNVALHAADKVPVGRVRLLLGCLGWPSGVLELASWSKHQGLAEVVVVQLQPDEAGHQRLAKRLDEFRPHVVGFRLEAGRFDETRQFIETVRHHSDAEVVLGGPTATSHPLDVLTQSGADYVFAGEAEQSLNQFLRLAWRRNSKDRAADIPGLAYRYGNRDCFNTLPRDGHERSVWDHDRLVCCSTLRCLRCKIRPAVSAELMSENRLDWSTLENFADPSDALYFTAGRGCPGACTFCAKLHGNEVRYKNAAQLLEEIEAADAKVSDGTLQVTRWPLFRHVANPELKPKQVAWAAVYDEDFLLFRDRAIEFFRLWDASPLSERYRLSFQANPCSMLAADGTADEDLLDWIDRLKPMVQLGAESFNGELLARWHKRHDLRQLHTALDALDRTQQDYTVFQLLTDFDTTPEELVDTLWLLIVNALRRRRMRIASSPLTIPLYDSDTRRLLEYGGRLGPDRIRDFSDYERPQPGWMDPLAAELAELADAELQFALEPEHRDAALVQAFESVVARLRCEPPGARIRLLCDQATWALDRIHDARFQPV